MYNERLCDLNRSINFPRFSYVERMAQQQIPKGICIYQKSMTASANKVIQSLPSKHTLESFQENELLVNITHHVLVPKHEVLTPEEKAVLLQR